MAQTGTSAQLSPTSSQKPRTPSTPGGKHKPRRGAPAAPRQLVNLRFITTVHTHRRESPDAKEAQGYHEQVSPPAPAPAPTCARAHSRGCGRNEDALGPWTPLVLGSEPVRGVPRWSSPHWPLSSPKCIPCRQRTPDPRRPSPNNTRGSRHRLNQTLNYTPTDHEQHARLSRTRHGDTAVGSAPRRERRTPSHLSRRARARQRVHLSRASGRKLRGPRPPASTTALTSQAAGHPGAAPGPRGGHTQFPRLSRRLVGKGN